MPFAVADGHLAPLRWHQLPPFERAALRGKLAGLYGATHDARGFDQLTLNRQQALLLILTRLRQLSLWDELVHTVDNVYGMSGVGMSFLAWPRVRATLSARTDFTRRFARHRDTAAGFYELRRPRAVLHFLQTDVRLPRWAVHFDLDSPVASPASAFRHLRCEVFGGNAPSCEMVAAALRDAE